MRSHGGPSQDFELNLAPIIDCFTVLIAFLLATASFLSIGFIEAGAAAQRAGSGAVQEPRAILRVRLTGHGEAAEFELSGKKSRLLVAELEARAQEWKNAHPNLETATLEADDAVEYRAVVEAMEKLRAAIPVIQLSGS
jgi:biopolymer transport protein ExbD